MKVLVIGGNRFFGKRLVASLLNQRGIHVTLLNRGQLGDSFEDRLDRIILDRRSLRKDHPALDGRRWDIVFDQVCYDATEAASACSTFNGRIGKLVFVSSQSVYPLGADLPESSFDPLNHAFPQPVSRDADYGEAKRQAEAVYFRDAAFPVTAVRFPIVLGEDDYTERLKFHVDHVLEARPIFVQNFDARISLIRSDDAARFLASLVSSDIAGPFNCCATQPVSLRRVFEMLEAQTGARAVLVPRESDGDDSPFGVDADWFMSTQKLAGRGFSAFPVEEWLPALIKHFVARF